MSKKISESPPEIGTLVAKIFIDMQFKGSLLTQPTASEYCVPSTFDDTFSFHAAPNCCCGPAAAGKFVCSRPEHLSAVTPCEEPRQGCNIARSRDNVANINIRTDIYNILLKDSVFPHMRNPRRIPGFGSNEGRRDSCAEIYSDRCDSLRTGHAHKFHQTFLQRNKKGSFPLQSGPGSVRPPLTASPCRTIIL